MSYLLIVLMVLLMGCTALRPQRNPRVAEWQAMADATQRAYGRWLPVNIDISTGTDQGGVWAQYGGDWIVLATTTLRMPHDFQKAVMAHELGHWINRDPWRVNQAHSFKMETDANARAVEILTRLGMSQEGSFMLMQKMLTSVPNKCAEAADLVSRFPAFQAVPREGC